MEARKVQASFDPETVVFSRKMGPVPAWTKAQMKRPIKTIGTRIDFIQKKYLMRVGCWTGQERGKFR
jgi:hypothetical protein